MTDARNEGIKARVKESGVGVNKLEEREIPLLSQEGWREAPEWFQSCNLASWRLRNHPSRDPLRDPAALLTQEGSSRFSRSLAFLFQITRISKFIHIFHAPLH
jgi:hypothetical protein